MLATPLLYMAVNQLHRAVELFGIVQLRQIEQILRLLPGLRQMLNDKAVLQACLCCHVLSPVLAAQPAARLSQEVCAAVSIQSRSNSRAIIKIGRASCRERV